MTSKPSVSNDVSALFAAWKESDRISKVPDGAMSLAVKRQRTAEQHQLMETAAVSLVTRLLEDVHRMADAAERLADKAFVAVPAGSRLVQYGDRTLVEPVSARGPLEEANHLDALTEVVDALCKAVAKWRGGSSSDALQLVADRARKLYQERVE